MKKQRIKNYILLLALTVVTIASGALFYHYVEGFAWVDAYYFTVGTMFTVGYGDLAPASDAGKIFTTLYMIIGVGIIGGFVKAAMHNRVNHSKIVDPDEHHADGLHE